MIKRGTIEKQLANGACLLNIGGIQVAFSPDHAWKSAERPQPGHPVEVEVDATGTVISVVAEPPAAATPSPSSSLLIAHDASRSIAHQFVERVGLPTVVATGVLAFSWFFLTTVSYDAGFLGHIGFTFWRLLGFLGTPSPIEAMQTMRESGGPGVYGLFACLVLACPFAGAVWCDRRAALGGVLPLIFLFVVVLEARRCLASLMAGIAPEVADAAREEMLKEVSLGFGAWVSAAAALYLAFLSVRRLIALHAVPQPIKTSNRGRA